MIDLHLHSTCSDGLFTINEILHMASEIGCEIISLVDHNTCAAYKCIQDNVGVYKGKIISGCEFNTYVLGIPVELLGYDFDVNTMHNFIKKMYPFTQDQIHKIQLELFAKKCKKNSVKINEEILFEESSPLSSSSMFDSIHCYPQNSRFFKSIEDFEDRKNFYRKYLSDPNSTFYCNLEQIYPSSFEIINAIKSCNGKVFIPHIYEYKNNAMSILEYFTRNYEIDGIEAYYSKFSIKQRKMITMYADSHGLLKSGGSDFHHGKTIHIGTGKGDLNISVKMLGKWVLNARDYNAVWEKGILYE